MGYLSETAYAIIFHSKEDREKLLGTLPAEQQEVIRQESDLRTPDRILFHQKAGKWYSSFTNVRAHDALVSAAEDAYGFEDEDNSIPSMGVFMRIGEENGDVEHQSWGEGENGFPYAYELIDEVHTLEVSWGTKEPADVVD